MSFHDLTLGIALGALQVPVGFHRFEPVEWNGIAPAPGNVLPDKEFRSVAPRGFPGGRTLP